MPATSERWGGRSHPGDLTGVRGRQLRAEAQARAKRAEAAQRAEEERSVNLSAAEQVAQVQATLKTGVAFWSDDSRSVEIDMTGSYR